MFFTAYYSGSQAEPNPSISAIQVNGTPTNTILAGTTGYLAAYGQYLDGVNSVTGPPGVTITSFQSYNNGTQLNIFFQAAANAATGAHNITVLTNHGTSSPSSGSSLVTVAVTLTSFAFSGTVPYSRDCAGAASPIAQPTWPSPSGATCPQQMGYTGDHAVYTAGATMSGTATFTLNPPPPGGVTGLFVLGTVPGVGNFLASNLSLPANTQMFQAPVAGPALPPGKTSFYNPMNVTWSFGQSTNDCFSGCASVGTSSNPVYATLAAPLSSLSPVMLTYVYLAVGSGGAASPANAVTNTWSLFSNGSGPANVKTWDGRSMNYYSAGFNACALNAVQIVESLTNNGGNSNSAQCGAFALLLESALAVNGVHSNWIQVQATDGELMVIKNWTLNSPSSPSTAPWVYKFMLSPGDFMFPPPPNYGDLVNNLPTLPGQNTAPPVEKIFNYHFIVQETIISGNQYLDPSYGVTYASASDFEGKAITGYAKQLTGDVGNNYHLRLPAPPANISFAVVPAKSY